MRIETLHTIDTEYSADSVEWCPHPDKLEYFACGTYQLDDAATAGSSGAATATSEAPCRRKGRIYLFKYAIEVDKLTELQRIETAAILDMKWLHHSAEFAILAAANALGQIHIYELQEDELVLQQHIELDASDSNLLALSLEWCPQSHSNSNANHRLIVSDSKGAITLLNYSCKGLEIAHRFAAHNFEAWTCTFDKWNANRIYTGGDDTSLNAFDIRDAETVHKCCASKSHMAGVTALLSHPKRENILLSGSYDDRLRLFDTRNLRSPIKELNLDGGIWRIRADPVTLGQSLILCACMYKNFSIVKLHNDCTADLQLAATYDEHESICYGADWCLKSDVVAGRRLVMGTCSFYDHKLCLSNVAYMDGGED